MEHKRFRIFLDIIQHSILCFSTKEKEKKRSPDVEGVFWATQGLICASLRFVGLSLVSIMIQRENRERTSWRCPSLWREHIIPCCLHGNYIVLEIPVDSLSLTTERSMRSWCGRTAFPHSVLTGLLEPLHHTVVVLTVWTPPLHQASTPQAADAASPPPRWPSRLCSPISPASLLSQRGVTMETGHNWWAWNITIGMHNWPHAQRWVRTQTHNVPIHYYVRRSGFLHIFLAVQTDSICNTGWTSGMLGLCTSGVKFLCKMSEWWKNPSFFQPLSWLPGSTLFCLLSKMFRF